MVVPSISETTILDITELINLIEPVLEENGFELVDLEYLSEHGKWVLRIYIDKDGGITIDDCAHASRELGDLIDVKDIIQNDYVLEISSPGLDRPLRKKKDFMNSLGKKVKVKMRNPINNQKNFIGYLKEFREEILYIEADGKRISLPFEDISKANVIYEF